MDQDLDAVLPSPLQRQLGPPPLPPVDFEDGYVLPVHSVKPLQTLHAHPHDARRVFYEKPHVYTLDGVPISVSVTGLAHTYEKPFVAQEAIGMMKTSRSQAWPRLEYVVNARADVPWTPDKGALSVREGKTVAVVQPHSMRTGATPEAMREMLRAARVGKRPMQDDDDEVYVFDRAKTDEEIATGWALNGMRASHMGTEAHYLAECFFNGVPFRWWEEDMRVLYDFCRSTLLPRGIVAYNTEKEIVCPDADLAGSIDLILYDPRTNVHHILDFKRSEKLRGQMRGYGKMSPPFAHLDDCKGAAYALQCSLYQYVLEKEYGMTIGERILLSLHPENPFCTSVPYLKAEVEYLMEGRFDLVRARKAVAEEDEGMRCALTGAPLVDAVRLRSSETKQTTTLVMEKMALVREEEEDYEVAQDVREAFDKAVEAKRRPPTLDAAACTSWKRLMPDGGIVPFGG